MIVTTAPNRQSDEYLIARSFLDLDDALSNELPKKFESKRYAGIQV